jgi:hexosaminidase
MGSRRVAIAIVLLAGFPACALADHSALLPGPQQIHYEAGRTKVRGLRVEMAPGDTGPEDAFAAKTLAACLSARASESVPVSVGKGEGRAIVLDRTGPVAPLAVPGEIEGPKSPQAYELKVGSDGAKITSSSSAGLYYGVETTCQLIEGNGDGATLPEVEIHDWPSFAYRGIMMDMSHGPLPTESEIDRQLDFLARWKANQYYLYSEASIELDGFPLLNPQGRFSKAEVRRIIAYGRERHIDVIPSLELYGHLHDLFRVERYADLSDFPHGVEFDPSNPKVKPLLADWSGQISELFPSPFVHVGFDETFQIRQAAERLGMPPGKLYLDQLKNVVNLFQSHGKHVMAWSDMMIKLPEVIPDLPAGLIAVPWRYHVEKDFTPWIGPLAKAGVPMIIQPGVTSWNQISPDFATTFANIDGFVAAGRQVKALGVSTSVWTDDGQMLMRASWPGMVYGVSAAWQSAPMNRSSFFSDYAHLVYPDPIARNVAEALEALTTSETDLEKALGQSTMISLWEDPFAPVYFKGLAGHRDDFRQARLSAEQAEESLIRALAAGGDPTSLNSLLVNSRLLDYAGLKFLNTIEIAELWQRVGPKRPDEETWWNEFGSQVTYQDHSRIVDLMDAITELSPQYRAEWLSEYTPYRLESALGRWGGEYQYWRSVQARLEQYSNESREGDVLPAIETVVGER